MRRLQINSDRIEELFRGPAYSLRLKALRMVANGKSCFSAAKTLDLSPQTIANWVRKFNTYGRDMIHADTSPGPKAFSILAPLQMEHLRNTIATKPETIRGSESKLNSENVNAWIKTTFGKDVSGRTVRRILASLNVSPEIRRVRR